jgi:osmoprotectant transport system ATP-binding protein
MNSIRFESVTKRYAQMTDPPVRGCSLVVEAGMLTALMGPSGSGKTTLLKMVNRLVEPDSGRITIDGKDLCDFPPTLLRRQIGYVIQGIGLFPHQTVAKNIAVVPELLGWSKARIHERVDELLEMIDLPPGEYRQRYPWQLSGGQQQRVGLARALAADPGIMLMDEPFGALDAITRCELQDQLASLQKRLHKTILFVTHDVEEALRLADRVAVMRAGEIIQVGTPIELLSHPVDRFVSDLMGAGDPLRSLSLVPVAEIMKRGDYAIDGQGLGILVGETALSTQDTLRDALALFLKSGERDLPVVEDNHIVGTLGIEQISQAITRHASRVDELPDR